MTPHFFPFRNSFKLSDKRFNPDISQRSLLDLDNRGFSYWDPTGVFTNPLVGNPVVQVSNGDVWVYKAPTGGFLTYAGIGEFQPSGVLGVDTCPRRTSVWCLLDYSVLNPRNAATDVWPVLHARSHDGGLNMMSIRMLPDRIQDQETGPLFELIPLNSYDVIRNKIVVNMAYYNDNVKAISLYAYDSPSDSLFNLIYPMRAGMGAGWGTLIPIFAVYPGQGCDEGSVIIHDFQISENVIPYGDRPIPNYN